MKNNWEIKTLGEVCEFRRGLTYSKGDEVPFSGNAVLRANNIDLETSTLNFDEIRYISDDIEIPQSKKLVKNSVMICTASGSKPHLGKVAFVDNDYEYAFGGFMGLLVPNVTIVDPKYFFTILTSGQFRNHVDSLTLGANINNLKFSQIQDYEVAIPPLAEQKRIVKILDEKFGAIEELKRVTEQQIADTKELFESRLEEIVTSPNEGWLHETIDDVALVKGGKRVPKGEKLLKVKTKHPYIRVSDFDHKGGVDQSDIHYISEEIFKKIKQYTITDRDLFISIAGTIGISGVVPAVLSGANLTENACKLVLKKELNLRYLLYFTRSKSFQNQAGLLTRTAAQPKLALTRIKTISFSYPQTLTDQNRIVKELDELFDKTKDLEVIFRRKIVDLDELKKSYLEQAFSGKL